ncbi:MAG: hypothetical protein VXW38_15050 [Bacteroidota bacterium]|nr:hypothetical protein [Bacteroidota bacterium]
MRINLILLIFLISNFNLLGQEQTKINKGKIIVPIKKELNLKAKIKKEKISEFEIKEEKNLTEPSEFMSSMEEKPENFDDIYIKFNKSDFGILLTVIHKLEKPIIYKAKIKIKGSNDLAETSIHPCYPNVVSVEQWRDDIEKIELYAFNYYKE